MVPRMNYRQWPSLHFPYYTSGTASSLFYFIFLFVFYSLFLKQDWQTRFSHPEHSVPEPFQPAIFSGHLENFWFFLRPRQTSTGQNPGLFFLALVISSQIFSVFNIKNRSTASLGSTRLKKARSLSAIKSS